MTDKPEIIIFWFRRDLRLADNHGLYQACEAAKQRGFAVLPIFIFDQLLLSSLSQDDARVSFIHQQLQDLQKQLHQRGSGLIVKHGLVSTIFKALIDIYSIRAVFANRDYEPQAIARDKTVKTTLNDHGIAWRSVKDQVIFERNEVLKNDGKPYSVFTPYKNRWLAQFDHCRELSCYDSDLSVLYPHKTTLPTLADIGFQSSNIWVKPYDLQALNRYEDRRNFPAILNGTSNLSPHLRFGTVSIREIVAIAQAENPVFLNELIWREFFMQILWHFPRVVDSCYRLEYEQLAWRNNEDEFTRWCDGKTGYPLVDAGMRQLNTTGYLHNRVRMVVAGFLCKHLLIDWRWGERYFAEKLLDYEQSSNNGNWQWAAGTGCDAAPYFRIFNPHTQFEKFDPEAEYVKRFVPEYGDSHYPEPMVEHKFARQRCLETYQKVK